MPVKLHRMLTTSEVEDFRKWARDNYIPYAIDIDPLWHPVIVAECYLIIAEQYIQ